MKKNELVSVIITTKNEQDVIRRLFLSLKNQSYKDNEILLIDNNSSDKTVEIAKKMGVKVFNFGPERSAQRNYGAKKSQGEYLLFLDADMQLTRNIIKQCIKCMESDSSLGAISIPEESIGNTYWEKVKAFERSFYNLEGDPTTDAARFFLREVFNKSGGYDTAITGPEDWDLRDTVLKLGYKIGRIKASIYHHERIISISDLLKKKYYYALKSHRYLKKQKISFISPETIYFLRPVFYKHIDRLITNPILSFGMIILLTSELVVGGLGFLIGRLKKL